ncbi:TPA: hypothetical protein DEO28_02175 [Candidatus Dependentiae bacterium]|nr:MAG: hypothetical protein UR14_C0009G0018 [candidate division TM6 bacterium GW2011_GWE2_31_21]KKP52541.1 MAG: hypothetical protein UR43_C0012G0010 [candidate division TM6 bacterium GW2011_GWF2_33_332]HBS48447.1 hypothetical protein [Candidatus Dependentiae bacterium]HBZ73296.1 hypothetical protein [Candidatus Dependentiae bacterium]
MFNKKHLLAAITVISSMSLTIKATNPTTETPSNEHKGFYKHAYVSIIDSKLKNNSRCGEFSAEILLTMEDALKSLEVLKAEYIKTKSFSEEQKKESNDKVIQHIKEDLIKPRTVFLNYIYEYKEMMEELVKWSFTNVSKVKIDLNDSILLKFLKSDLKTKEQIESFFLDEVTTIKKAKSLCTEFYIFTNPLWMLLNPYTKEKSIDWIKDKKLRTEQEIEALKKGPYFAGTFEQSK